MAHLDVAWIVDEEVLNTSLLGADVGLWTMPSFRDVSRITEHLRDHRLPFTWQARAWEGDAIELEVMPEDRVAATEYFTAHPLELADGTPVPVRVTSGRPAPDLSPPRDAGGNRSSRFDQDSLIGLDVDEATTRAESAGWLVRAYVRGAMLTADHDPRRLNLCHGDDRLVESVHEG